jgi:hypothetical protein
LRLPKSWEGKYEALPAFGGEGVAFIDKANKAYSGYLFGISLWNKAAWAVSESTALAMGHTFKLGEEGDTVFTLSTPGDVNYDPHNEKLTAEYASMHIDIKNIQATFQIKKPVSLSSDLQLELLKPVIINLFNEHLKNEENLSLPADRRIKDFLIHNDIKILKNDQNTYFIVPYDTLRASNEFVVAGGGVMDQDGWLRNRESYVVIQMINGQYQIKSITSGP